ncbi:MAG TPA: hypothetical protein VNG90_03045 [Candidatus Acidoferrum sp.]|nr:hypothetical protein [Candidatus Acidoferrum sp.]
MLLKLEEGDYIALPPGADERQAQKLLGRNKKIRISGLIAIAVITAVTIMLLVITQHAIAPIEPIGVLVFGLSLLKFYNDSVEFFGGLRLRRRLRRFETEGKLVWVPVGLKIRADAACRQKKTPVQGDLFSYDMTAARSLAVLYRGLGNNKKRQGSAELREQLDTLIDNRIAA